MVSFLFFSYVVFYRSESIACDYNNKLDGFDVPVIGILCDGTSFEFFSFSAKGKTYKFNCGCLPGDPIEYRCGLQLTDFTPDDSAARGRFVGQILFHKFDGDPICEIIFDLLMGAYVSSMTQKLFREQSESEKKLKGRKGRKVGFGELEPSSDRWDEALDYEEAFGKFRAAVKKKSEQAKILVEDAMNSLKLRYEISN